MKKIGRLSYYGRVVEVGRIVGTREFVEESWK